MRVFTGLAQDQRDIVLAAVNAGYSHPAFGLMYLMANLEELRERCILLEGTRRSGVRDLADRICALSPRILGISVSIWNHEESRQLAEAVREQAPETLIVMGGPEASWLPASAALFEHCDVLIRGEGELAFRELCRNYLGTGARSARDDGKRPVPGSELHLWDGGRYQQLSRDQLLALTSPYSLLDDHEIPHRRLYLEASRGCPFRCEFCLSSIQGPVRNLDLDALFTAVRRYWEKGGRFFKMIDRSFNLEYGRSERILDFFLELFTSEPREHAYVQFEMVPDRFPPSLRSRIAAFPPGSLRLELGIQTFNPEVAARINRQQDYGKSLENLRFIREETGAVLHADLIAGLPGEDLQSFAAGFDLLHQLGPGEIQLGLLKKLPGTSLGRHDREFGMIYMEEPPYEVLETSGISRKDMERVKRAAKFWELAVNRGRYPELISRIFPPRNGSFDRLLQLSDGLFSRFGRTWGIDTADLEKELRIFAEACGA